MLLGGPRGGTANRPMPIIELPARSEPLSQGDVLEGVRLFATATSWDADGGTSQKAPHKLCLVLSRPCVAAHKKHVTVAGIEKYPDQVPKDVDSFAKVRAFLTDMRDGFGSPDIFYLGQLPNRTGRFCARLDALYCVEVPGEPSDLENFLARTRIGSLSDDFVRDLHLRVFMAVASLGFHDNKWLSDGDLNWLVEVGEKEVKTAELELQSAKAEKSGRDAEGKQFKEGTIERLEDKLTDLQDQLEPFASERTLRQSTTA